MLFTFGVFFVFIFVKIKTSDFFSATEFYSVYSLTISCVDVNTYILQKFNVEIHNLECTYVHI